MPLPASASDATTYGMPTSPTIGFANYQGIPVTDPTTDQDAAAYNQQLADVAAMTRTAVRAAVIFTTNATTPVLVSHWAQWGSGLASTPVLTRVGLGHYRITWPANVNDDLGVLRALNLQFSIAQPDGATPALAQSGLHSANSVDVYTFDTSFGASDLSAANIKVVTW